MTAPPDDFMPWNGDDMPVGRLTPVKVRLRMGSESKATPAWYWRWDRSHGKDSAGDVVAWRRA